MAWHEFVKAISSKKYFKQTIPIIIIGGLFNFFWGLATPIFSIRINEITGSLIISGFVLGLWGIIKFFTDIPAGALCDKIGSKKIITFALIAYFFITFMYAVVEDTFSLIVLRIIHSVLGSLYWVSYWSAIRSVPKKFMEEEVSLSTIVRNISLVIAPIIGSIIIIYYSWKAPFYILSLSFILMLFVSRRLPDRKSAESKSMDLLVKGIKEFFKKGRKAYGVLLGTLLYGTGISFLGSFLPIIMNNLGYSIAEIGIILSIASSTPWIIMPLLLLGFIEKHGESKPIAIGVLMVSLGFFLVLFSNDFFSIMLSVLIANIGFSMIMPSVSIMVGEMANHKNIGGFTGVTETVKDFSSFLGCFAGGFLLQMFSMSVFGMYAGFLVFSMPFLYFLLR